jgi:hypothetical protein
VTHDEELEELYAAASGRSKSIGTLVQEKVAEAEAQRLAEHAWQRSHPWNGTWDALFEKIAEHHPVVWMH